MAMQTLLPIGRITKAHGIRGDVCVEFHALSPDLLRGELYLAPPGFSDASPLPKARAVAVRIQGDRVLARFEGVEDRNAADALRGHTLLIPKDALPPPDDGEAYVHQLYGLSVSVAGDTADERELGVITAVEFPAGQELWTIATPAGEEILFPAVPDFVQSLDIAAGRAVITPPPGLLELYIK